jgi:serine/threonine protein kinase
VSLLHELTLADDVSIFGVGELAPETRATVPHDPDDFIVSRGRSRESSRVIDRDARDLLLEFRKPTRVVDAVLRFAARRETDPEATLERAYELLDRMYRSRVLVAPDERRDDRSGLGPGSVCFGLTLGPRVHDLEDTEVFFGRDAAGRAVAVKLVAGGIDRVAREADTTRRAGDRAPEVRGVHDWEGRGVLVSEWIVGDEVTRAAAALRGRRDVRSEAALLALSCDLADAVAEVHRAGVVHGDLQPRNVLVEASGRVRLIDFGSAVDREDRSPARPRRGVAFYVEPELAAASLRGEDGPSTEAGEQYALGALLYFLWTGVHYLDWSLTREDMLGQIVGEAPVPFKRRHVSPWPELERVLGRALAKSPDRRFTSCGELATALRALYPEARARDEVASKTPVAAHRASRERIDTFFDVCGLGGTALRDGPANPPFVSVNYGAAGVAYAMYRLALARDDAHLLALADVWAQKALALSRHEQAFFSPDYEIDEEGVGRASLFHSPSGVHAVRALVALARGEAASARKALSDFDAASRAPCEYIDLTLGKAGLLVGCAEVLEAARGALGVDESPVLARGGELRDEIQRVVARSEIATDVSTRSLGIAHGWGGLLFALLRWCQAAGEAAEPYRGKLEELAALREPDGTGIRWPMHNRSIDRPTYMSGWCNGPAGHALLWALAHDLPLGNLCCGLAGVGYACAAAHRVTGDAVWLSRARNAGRRACEDRSPEFHRDSLYKGAVGAVLLLEQLDCGSAAAPFVER